MDLNQKLLQSIMEGNLTAAQELLALDPGLVDARTPAGVPVVLFALYYNQPAFVKTFLERGAQVDVFTAAALGMTERLLTLIKEQPGRVDAVAPDGYSPLGLACFFGHEKVVDVLLANRAQVNKPSENPQRVMPLHSASAGDRSEHNAITQKLIAHGADVNARQAGDFTPLHAAAQNGNAALVALLLENGAEINPRTSEGRTPLFYAREGGYADVIAMLEAKGGQV